MPKIAEMFAFIAEDSGPDDEGIIAWRVGDVWMPLTGADVERVNSLRPYAALIASSSGKPVRLIKFTQREELETIQAP